ncbi:hypothetical protein SAMN05192571_101824 [Pleomorphomonas diazotrophica]|nr:hypothetical protein SAMN05192571_101824 [Pleomorphomonas diazotrophica]
MLIVSFRIRVKAGLTAMDMEILVTCFSIALGFVLAGLLSSLYQLVTSKPARFEMQAETILLGIAQTFLIMFAGPAILMRNAIRGRRIEHRNLGWLVASTAIAGAWSLCSGVMLLPFFIVVAQSIG